MSHTHSTTKRRTFKHLNAYQRGQIEAMLRLGIPKGSTDKFSAAILGHLFCLILVGKSSTEPHSASGLPPQSD